MRKGNGASTIPDPILTELKQIRRLLILQLVNSGVEAQHIAKVLGISKSRLSRIVPARSVISGKG